MGKSGADWALISAAEASIKRECAVRMLEDFVKK
jgi:hypothetical protein